MIVLKFFFLLLFFICCNCSSLSTKKQETAPKITHQMTIDAALTAAINYGHPTLEKVKNLIKKRKEQQAALLILQSALLKNTTTWPQEQIQHAFNLYQNSNPSNTQVNLLFDHLIVQENSYLVKMAWILASNFPSDSLEKKIETILTTAIIDDNLYTIFIPEMATAIAHNNMTNSYTVLRQGLFTTHHLSFAQSMRLLSPQRASADFLDYLALAPLEEIRQLNFSTVNMLVCFEALNHLRHHEAPLGHKNFQSIFKFTTARNQGLAEISGKIIYRYIPNHSNHLALILTQLPTWVQLAYIERIKLNYKPLSNILLAELKKISIQYDVLEELKTIVQ